MVGTISLYRRVRNVTHANAGAFGELLVIGFGFVKRAGRLDRKIPFFYPQTEAEVKAIGKANARRNKLSVDQEILEKISGNLIIKTS